MPSFFNFFDALYLLSGVPSFFIATAECSLAFSTAAGDATGVDGFFPTAVLAFISFFTTVFFTDIVA